MTDDDFMTDDERDIQRRVAALKAQADHGQLFVDWMRSPAGVLFARMLDEQISDAKNAWMLAGNRDNAEVVRIQSQVYLKIKQWIASQIQSGKAAQVGITEFEREGAALSSQIKPPERTPA